MKAEIEIECKEPNIIIKSLEPDAEQAKRFDVELKAENNKIKLEIKSKDVAGLLAGINSYMRLVKTAMDSMEA